MKRKGLVTGLGLVAACSILFSVSASLMWFNNRTRIAPNQIVGSSNGAYYASGDGSKDDPFVINQPRHLYNLAWLQYLGAYNQEEDGTVKEVYFKVEGNTTNEGGDSVLDMDGWTLPPIGTEENPFVGNFDGNKTIIKNLTVSNTFNDYEEAHPYYNADGNEMTQDNFVQPKIIGFFGVVGALDTKNYEYTTNIAVEGAAYTEANLVYDTYVDNITIQNKTTNQELLAGLLAGYVNAPIKQCGVGYGEFSFANGTKNLSTSNTPSGATIKGVSNYSLIGAYNPDKFEYTGLPGSDGGSGDAGYGSSTNIRELHSELTSFSLVDSDGNGILRENYAIPFQADINSSIIQASGTTTINSKTVNNASTVSVKSDSTNIGYYVGGTVNKTYDSTATMKVLEDHYYTTSIKVNYDNIKVSDNSDIKTVPDRVKTYLNKSVSNDIKQGDSVIKLTTPNLLDETMDKASGYYLIPGTTKNGAYAGGRIGDYTGNIYIPNNCIWVAPQKAGTFEFVVVNENSALAILSIWKLKRITARDYSSELSKPSSNQQTNFNDYPSADVVGMKIPYYSSGSSDSYTAYYYGTPVTQNDIDEGIEFAVTLYGNAFFKRQVYITYMDIGSDAGGSSDEPSKTSPTEIDFVYYGSDKKLVKITSDGTYVNSEVVFQIDSGASGTIAFKRTYTDGTSIVYYYIPTASSINITAIGTDGKSSQSDSELAEN